MGNGWKQLQEGFPCLLTWRLDQLLVVDILLRVPEHTLEPVVLDVLRVGEDVGVVAPAPPAGLAVPHQVEAVQVGAAPPAPALSLAVQGRVAEGVTRAPKP